MMKALQYRKSIPRYALMRWLGPRFRPLYTSPASPVALREIEEPRLPGARWLRIAPRLAGVCGSDLATICAKGSAYLAPLTSMPFVMGHEVVGNVVELGGEVRGLSVGDRVVLRPALGCRVRDIHPPCTNCRVGCDALCRNVRGGIISAGIQTGFCRDTGGGFSEGFVAHESQVHRVPDELDDPTAVLTEPFACALHGCLRLPARHDDQVLVIGCGTMGLLTIGALRALGSRARIVAVARHDHQRQHALDLGADEILGSHGSVKERYAAWAKALDARVLDPELGKPTVLGGAGATFDCVASAQTIDDGLRFTRSGGVFVLVGMPAVPRNVDWTPMWFKELTIRTTYAYGLERVNGEERDTFALAMDLLRTCGSKLRPLVGEPHELADYRSAIAAAIDTGRSGVVKTVFSITNG